MRYHRMMKCIAVSLTIGILAALSCVFLPTNAPPMSDLGWPICGARAVWGGDDPYDCPRFAIGLYWPTNPMTTILAALPFVWLTNPAPAIFGVISGLLAFGLTRGGQYWRLLVFLSASYWQARYFVQWSPLIAACALVPALLPLWIIKPHIGLPVALASRWSTRTFVAMLVFGGLTLAIYPLWPLRWIATIGGYNGSIPLLTLPIGPVLLLALFYWRDRDARFLLFMACVPQQLCYDALALFTLPRTARELLILLACSWIGYAGWSAYDNAALWTVASIYVPVLLLHACAQPIRRRVVGTAIARRKPNADICNGERERLGCDKLPKDAVV